MESWNVIIYILIIIILVTYFKIWTPIVCVTLCLQLIYQKKPSLVTKFENQC